MPNINNDKKLYSKNGKYNREDYIWKQNFHKIQNFLKRVFISGGSGEYFLNFMVVFA